MGFGVELLVDFSLVQRSVEVTFLLRVGVGRGLSFVEAEAWVARGFARPSAPKASAAVS